MKEIRECICCHKPKDDIVFNGLCSKCLDREMQLEKSISDCLVEAWNTFISLEQTHPSDIDDFNKGIHDLQKVIGMRELRRLMPEKYPCK